MSSEANNAERQKGNEMAKRQFLKDRELHRTLRRLSMEARTVLMVMANAGGKITRQQLYFELSKYKITTKKIW